MLQPRELKRAQGFPDDYEIRGTKTDTTRQIGNAVPVNLAQTLIESLLGQTLPALTDYIENNPDPVETTAGSNTRQPSTVS
jgi:DNA (cytosine-5)-methyltransferase 1